MTRKLLYAVAGVVIFSSCRERELPLMRADVDQSGRVRPTASKLVVPSGSTLIVIKMEGLVALVRDNGKLWALAVNGRTDSQRLVPPFTAGPLPYHNAAVRVDIAYLGAAAAPTGVKAIFPLGGEDLKSPVVQDVTVTSLNGGVCSTPLDLTALQNVVPVESGLKTLKTSAARLTGNDISGRLILDHGLVSTDKVIEDGNGIAIEWTLDGTHKFAIAQTALAAMVCPGNTFTLKLNPPPRGMPAGGIQMKAISSELDVDFVNLLPDDVLELPGAKTASSKIEHFEWFYLLAKTSASSILHVPQKVSVAAAKPTAGGKPFCSFAEFTP